MFSFIDIFIAIGTLLFLVFGYSKGALKGTGKVLGFIGGVTAFFTLGDPIAAIMALTTKSSIGSAAFFTFVAFMFVGLLVGWGISAALTAMFKDFETTVVNAVLGSVLGLVRSVFLFSMLCVFSAFWTSMEYEESWAASSLLPIYGAVLKTTLPVFPATEGQGVAKGILEMTYNEDTNRPYLSDLEYEHESAPEEEEPSNSELLQQIIQEDRST